MPIKYDKLLKLLADNGYTSYKIKKEKLIGQATFQAIKNGTGGLDAKSLAKLCAVFHCQPGDLMEYVEDEQEVTSAPEIIDSEPDTSADSEG